MNRRRQDLSDITFIIPFSYDLPERLRNLKIVTNFLVEHFETNIIVSEYDSVPRLSPKALPPKRNIRHFFFEKPECWFERSRSVNLGSREVSTPYLAICDTDVLLESHHYIEGIKMLREDKCDLYLPFANRVMWIPAEEVKSLESRMDDETLASLNYNISDNSYIFLGLINFISTHRFREAGMMNENFKSWGYEEMEFYIRLLKLGYRVLRGGGHAYHLGHDNGGNTGPNHEHYLENQREYHKILAFNPDELREYVSSWDWNDYRTV